MRSKLPNIGLCFLAAAGLTATTYFFFQTPQHALAANEEQEDALFIAMTPAQIEESAISLAIAKPEVLQTALSAPARIQLDQDKVMHLVPKVAGIVRTANKWVGDSVAQGETLAILESGEMAVAKSAYLDSLKKEVLASQNLDREKQLHEKQISAAQDFQNAVTESEQAHIELELARQRLHTLGLTRKEIDALPDQDAALLRHYQLRSPMQGIIIKKNITKGEQIDTNREIYVLADCCTVWAEVHLFPTDFAFLQKDVTLDLIHPNGKKVTAELISISPSVDAATGAVKLIATVANPQSEWLQGMYALAILKGKAISVPLAVPKEAIQQIDGEPTLFVATEGGFEVRTVKTGQCDSRCVEILFGLAPGETYAATNTFLLKAEHGKDEAQHMD